MIKSLDDFADKRIVVAGDLVADQFLTGTIDRVSREAPVFILRHDETETRPGAAANAAANIAALGGTSVAIGVVGDDVTGVSLLDSFRSGVVKDGIIRANDFQTTTKVRVLAGHQYAARQQVIRIDYEERKQIGETIEQELINRLRSAAESADAIVISDYGYGVVTPRLFGDARSVAAERNIPLVVDSRSRLQEFAGATSATPNQDEVQQILGKDFTDVDCEKLRQMLGLEALLVTCGNKGMLLLENGRDPVELSAVGSTEPVDVTGAGDTVIATYALGLAAGLGFGDAAWVANHAGGLVVMRKGTATVTAAELADSLKTATLNAADAASDLN